MALDFEQHETITRLTLNYPPRNALDLDAIVELGTLFEAYPSDRPLIITGAGEAFSAGVDVKAFASYSDETRAAFFKAITRMTAALCGIATPVVAAVNGHALGGGLVLTLCADYRIAVDADYKFGLTEARAGVPFPEGPIEIIKAEVPAALLRHLTLSSSVVRAHLLHEHCVLDELVEPDLLKARAEEVAVDLAAQPAFGAVKRQIRGELIERLSALV